VPDVIIALMGIAEDVERARDLLKRFARPENCSKLWIQLG
jgi:hypothetical protein